MKLKNLKCSIQNCTEEPIYRVGVADRMRIYCEKHFNQYQRTKFNKMFNKQEKLKMMCGCPMNSAIPMLFSVTGIILFLLLLAGRSEMKN